MVSDDNIDSKVISDFGDEWAEYGYTSDESAQELALQFQKYSSLVNFNDFDPRYSSAADFGAGTGRWAQFILKNFRKTYLVEPSDGAFALRPPVPYGCRCTGVFHQSAWWVPRCYAALRCR